MPSTPLDNSSPTDPDTGTDSDSDLDVDSDFDSELDVNTDFEPDVNSDSDSESMDDGLILKEYRRIMYQFSFIGIEFGVAVLVGVLVGRFLDKKFDTAPWLMLACLLFSLMVASRDLYRLVRREYKKQSKKDSSP